MYFRLIANTCDQTLAPHCAQTRLHELCDSNRIASTTTALDCARARIRSLVAESNHANADLGPVYRHGLQAFDHLRSCAMVNTDDLKHLFALFTSWLSP